MHALQSFMYVAVVVVGFSFINVYKILWVLLPLRLGSSGKGLGMVCGGFWAQVPVGTSGVLSGNCISVISIILELFYIIMVYEVLMVLESERGMLKQRWSLLFLMVMALTIWFSYYY